MSTRDWTIIGAVIAIIGLLIAVVMLALRDPNGANGNETNVNVQAPVEAEGGDADATADTQAAGGDAETTVNTTTNVTVNTPEEDQQVPVEPGTEQSQEQSGASTSGADSSVQQQEMADQQQQRPAASVTEQSRSQNDSSTVDAGPSNQQQEETDQQQQENGENDPPPPDPPPPDPPTSEPPTPAPPNLDGIEDGERICASPACPEQYVVRIVGDQRFKRLLLSYDIVTFYGQFDGIQPLRVSQEVLDAFETSCFTWFNNGGSRTYYHFDARPGTDDGEKRRIAATEFDLRNAGIASAAFEVNGRELAYFADRGSVTLAEAMRLPCIG